MKDEHRKLIEDNINLVYNYLHDRKLPRDEDLIQDLFLKVCKSIEKYDPEKSALSTYIYTILDNEVKKMQRLQFADVRKIYAKGLVDSINKKVGEMNGEDITIEDSLLDKTEDPKEKFEEMVCEDFIKYLKTKLDKKEKFVLDCMLKEKKQKDIAKDLNLSQQRVAQIVKNIKEKAKLYWGIYSKE